MKDDGIRDVDLSKPLREAARTGEPIALTDAKTDAPSITVTFGEGGDLTYKMHNMSGVILHAIAAVLHHEAEKLLFQQDVQQAQRNGSKLRLPGRGM